MREQGRFRDYLSFIIISLYLSVFGALGAVYLSRSPILIVTDISFSLLYGPQRLVQKEILLSWELFRRVIPVLVDEGAGPELVAIAAQEAYKTAPGAILFPFRYKEGAGIYKESNPEVPVLVIGGPKPNEETGLAFFLTDSAWDMYRAGLCAPLLAGEAKVMVLSDGDLQDKYREAFQEGLKIRGFLDEPIFVNASNDYSSYSELGCAVVAGPASVFLEQNKNVPVILFSWADPELTPETVKLVFDDSLWTLAPMALRSFKPEESEFLICSIPVIFKDRLAEKRDFRNLKAYVKEKFDKR
ncbi:MAG: hypothetical protein LBH43_06110 [Treponema sp.]|jgi:hypothetical protein|nr:hypothetical protein [Treponema sp.]